MGQLLPQFPLSSTAQARWRRAADELLIDAIFGDILRADRRADRLGAAAQPPAETHCSPPASRASSLAA